MKVVLNREIGSCFCLSSTALAELAKLKGRDQHQRDPHRPVLENHFGLPRENGRPDWVVSLARNDSDLVAVVEKLGLAAAGSNAELLVVEIPDGRSWTISDVVGHEFIVIDGKVY